MALTEHPDQQGAFERHRSSLRLDKPTRLPTRGSVVVYQDRRMTKTVAQTAWRPLDWLSLAGPARVIVAEAI
jgi:hypothetical protein